MMPIPTKKAPDLPVATLVVSMHTSAEKESGHHLPSTSDVPVMYSTLYATRLAR